MNTTSNRRLAAGVVLIFLIASWLPYSALPVSAQSQLEDPAEAATYFSRLESRERSGRLYDLMHPDAQKIIPESAVVGWYETEFAPRGPGEVTVESVEFVRWTWAVNGKTYRNAAEVTYTQPFDDGSLVREKIHLVKRSGDWLWFFGGSLEFVEEQIAIHGDESHDEDNDAQIRGDSELELDDFSVDVFCPEVQQGMGNRILAYCDWPAGLVCNTARCIPQDSSMSWQGWHFRCLPGNQVEEEYHPNEVVLEFAPQVVYPISIVVGCSPSPNQGFGARECSDPSTISSMDWIPDPFAITIGDEIALLCRH